MIAPARLAAYETLVAVEAGRADLPSALARAREHLQGSQGDRDRALAGEIAAGTLRWQGAFDAVIMAFAAKRVARLDREVLVILRLSIFQLLHLDRVPASAVVDDAVELTRRAGKRSASGFVNAVLRRVSREREQLPLPTEPPIDVLSIAMSHPRWLAARWLARYGFEHAAAWMRFDNLPAPLTLRANRIRTTPEALAAALAGYGVETRPGEYAADSLIVTRGNPLLTPLAAEGWFVVQDEASQLVGAFAEAADGERILDTCASPGGKTSQMAARVGDRGLVVAADARGRRIDLLARTVAAAGAARVAIVQADARSALPFSGGFDAVLVDAPCSGLGTVRRDPDVKWRRREEDLPGLAAAQLEMLRRAADMVRPGGRVIYATCSSEPEENRGVVDAFLADAPGFRQVVPRAFHAAPLAGLVDENGALTTLPFRDGLEAFYAACLLNS